MAGFIKDEKLYIAVAESDTIKENRLKGWELSGSVTGNYYLTDNIVEKGKIVELLDGVKKGVSESGVDLYIYDKPVYTSKKECNVFYKIMTSRVKNKYSKMFVNEMNDFDEAMQKFLQDDVLIANKLIDTGRRAYFDFDKTDNWNDFLKIIYGELTYLVIVNEGDKFKVYPEFHPMFIKKEELETTINNFDDLSNTNIIGIHMKKKNSALSDEHPHVCIGWSMLGDLSNIKTKDDLNELYAKISPNDSPQRRGAGVGQIWIFLNHLRINDIVVYFDGNKAHFGKVTSNYYYDTTMDSDDNDYVNKKNVKWVKSINYKDLPADFRSSGSARKSVFFLNGYKSYVTDVLNDKDISLDETIDYEDDFDEYEVDDDLLREKFQEWLVSNNNPDYTGKEKYANYGYCLCRLLKKGFELKVFDVNKLSSLSLENVDSVTQQYKLSDELKRFDKEKLQTNAGIAALNEFKNFLIYRKDNEKNTCEECHLEKKTFDYKSITLNNAKNLVVYGTPGCGKSYYVKNTILNGYIEENIVRTTFYQDYTNTDFVGQIMPVIKNDGSVTYEFNPGPFTIALEKSLNNPDKPVALVIEELNRGNAPSIFGDIFQLLDRKNGLSEYHILNVNIQKYLTNKIDGYKFDKIMIPANLSIIATMNTSDQNVFTLDTAFKRRWKFEKISNDFKNEHPFKDKYLPGMDLDWKEFCTAINKFILSSSGLLNSEDKQLGVFFIDESGLRSSKEEIATEEDRRNFAFKIFEYLWDDVAKFNREDWFKNAKSLDELIKNYVDRGSENKGLEVFADDIFKSN